jgi:hypothetical protein
MAAAPFLTDLPIERPSKNGSHFDEPFIRPFLAKHSKWYRRRHSQAQPVAEAGLSTDGQSQTRTSSAASEPTEAAAAEPELDVNQAEPLGKEEQKRRMSSVAKALRRAFWYNGNE